jgi:hypothetical protein
MIEHRKGVDMALFFIVIGLLIVASVVVFGIQDLGLGKFLQYVKYIGGFIVLFFVILWICIQIGKIFGV